MKIFLLYSIVDCVVHSITKQVRCNLSNKTPDNELIVGKVYEEILFKDRSIFKHVTVYAKNYYMNKWIYTITFTEYNTLYNEYVFNTTRISSRYIISASICE